jgi:hypothetical protein
MFDTSKWVGKLTVTVLPEDGDKERRNASEYLSNSVTWRVKDSALSVGVTEDTINYISSYHVSQCQNVLWASVFVTSESTAPVTCYGLKDFFQAEAALFLLATASRQNLTTSSRHPQWILERYSDEEGRTAAEADVAHPSNADSQKYRFTFCA